MNRRHALCLVGASVAGLTVPDVLGEGGAAGPPDGRAAPGPFDTVLNGFHARRNAPHAQAETERHCTRLNDDVLQCVIFHSSNGKLLGVEYVITDRCYRRLPLEDKAYWHPHSYEVLSGQLIAPGLPADREDELLRGLVTTWGKAWQTWPEPTTELPEGEPVLLWSVTRDGTLDPRLLEDRDRRLGVSTRANRARRQAFGHPVPRVDPPESVHEIGRQ